LYITELPVVAGVSVASTVGAVVGVLLAAALLIAAAIVTSIVVYTMYIKKSKLQIIMS
jgi:heme O synthase-like polyprenyltransferase